MSDVGDQARLELARDRLRKTVEGNGGQKAVARLTGIPLNTLGNYVRGIVAEPPVSNMLAIAKACAVDPVWLMALDDSALEAARGFREGDAVPFEGVLEGLSPKLPVNRGRWTIVSRALDLAGFLPGDIVEFDLGGRPRPGEIVVAQYYRGAGATTVLRLYQPPYLTVHTSDRDIDARPIQLDDAGERVRIAGAFLRMVRERR